MENKLVFTVHEYAGNLTAQTHITLEYLVKNKYLTVEQCNDLSSRLVVATIQNEKSFGKRLLERFFGKDDDNTNRYVFPLVSVDPIVTDETPSHKGKPKLKLIDTQNDNENS